MTDLNSIFMVGRLTKPVDVSNGKVSLVLKNKRTILDPISKAYKDVVLEIPVTYGVPGPTVAQLSSLKKGSRIGVNGALILDGSKLKIEAYAVQFLPN